jgi:arylsulfatase A-like enzyme
VSVVVVLSLDHWHAGLCGFCGGEPMLCPRLDRLAAESAVFDRHFSTAPAGDESVNGLSWAGMGWGMGRIEISAAERFEAAGVGVEVISDAQPEWLALAGWESVESADGGLERSTVEAVGRLARSTEEHRMLWVAASAPAETEQEEQEEQGEESDWLENLEAIDRALGGFDRCVGAAIDGLEQAGLSDEALLVVTGGRGAWLGDRGFEDPARAALHEERLRTPLLLRGPGIEPCQRRLELVQVIDLLPTLLAWFAGDRGGEGLRGINLLSLLEQGGSGGHHEIVVQDAQGGYGIRSHDLFLVRSAGEEDEPRLFSKPDDAWDLVDVSGQGLEEVQRLGDRLDELLGPMESTDAPSD